MTKSREDNFRPAAETANGASINGHYDRGASRSTFSPFCGRGSGLYVAVTSVRDLSYQHQQLVTAMLPRLWVAR
jgi:hypothetical protein